MPDLPSVPARRQRHADHTGRPGRAPRVTGASLYLTVLGLLGFGLGTVFRTSAGAIAVLFGALFVPTLLVALLPPNAGDTIYTVR